MGDAEMDEGEMDEGGNATIRYQFSRTTGYGRLADTSTLVYVHKIGRFDICDFHVALSLSHVNILPCLMVDTVGKAVIYMRFDKYLSSHIEILRHAENIDPSKKHNGSSANGSNYFYTYVPPVYRALIRGLISFIVGIHGKDLSVKDLKLENLVIKEGKVMAMGVAYCVASEKTKSKDFDLLSQLLQKLFPEFGDTQHPELVDTLFDEMFKYPSGIDGYLANHISILSPSESLSFIRNLVEMRSAIRCNSRVDSGFEWARNHLPLTKNWINRLNDNTKCFVHVYNFYQRRRSTYPISPNVEQNVSTILRLCRNMVAHMADDLALAAQGAQGANEFGFLEIEIMILSVYGKELATFQKNLHDQNVLWDIMFGL